ncbi:sugar ABC transporter substrate-binding protein [Actinomadura roseirufa]|uniref:sugar ABC transporter substrate-binding protein n=1 Tax=Actinomadura roseirufa TaxID=2094049 RepID=UPI001041629C|nr:sugar ABC transporter substrate-binding protein [Actinomadura roseirufa]
MNGRWAGLAMAALVCLSASCSDSGADEKGKAGTAGKARIAFFGFAKANSFSAATFAGVEEYAKAHNAAAEFLDANLDPQAQVRQLQDAVTSKRFQVFVVQANDGAAVVAPLRAAVRAGIKVVVDFTPAGTRYDTAEPQVPGTITLVDVPARNGRTLGELAVQACRSKKIDPCDVAYFEGLKALPLDNARTKAAEDALAGQAGVRLKARIEGGYTQQTGRKAMQDLLQREPGVDVVVGSSQALLGAEAVAKGKPILYVANGGSRQTVKAVQDGRWYAAYYLPVKTLGAKTAELGLNAARGQNVPATNVMTDLVPGQGKGTREALAGVTGEYDE